MESLLVRATETVTGAGAAPATAEGAAISRDRRARAKPASPMVGIKSLVLRDAADGMFCVGLTGVVGWGETDAISNGLGAWRDELEEASSES